MKRIALASSQGLVLLRFFPYAILFSQSLINAGIFFTSDLRSCWSSDVPCFWETRMPKANPKKEYGPLCSQNVISPERWRFLTMQCLATLIEKCHVHSSNSPLSHERSIIGQLNVPVATAANEEQYTFTLILKFSFDKKLFLKGRQINWQTLALEFIFRQSFKFSQFATLIKKKKKTLLSIFKEFCSHL